MNNYIKKRSLLIGDAITRGGGPSAVAREINVTPAAVVKWRRVGRVPAERVIALEAITGVSRHKLRPDIYPVRDNDFDKLVASVAAKKAND